MARRLSVLIVDPNLDTRLDIARALEAAGLDLAGEAAHGTEATVLCAEQRPSLVLVSLEDPPARALATLEALQRLSPDTPVIAYSSVSEARMMREAMRRGVRDYLVKPLTANDLRDATHTALAQEEQRQFGRWADGASTTARGTVITVAGAKGGIGKTTIAVNLAVALRVLTQQEVVVADADAQFGDVAVMLDLDIAHSVADLARDESEINRATVQKYLAQHRSGIKVLGAAARPDDWRALGPEHVGPIASALAETHEYVVLDTPGAMNELVAESLNAAAVVVLMTSLDVSSVKDTKTALQILESWAFPRERVRLTVNDTNRAAGVSADDVARATGMTISQVLPYDDNVGLAVQTGVPVVQSHPKSKFARGIVELAGAISGVAPQRKRSVVRPLAAIPLFGRGQS